MPATARFLSRLAHRWLGLPLTALAVGGIGGSVGRADAIHPQVTYRTSGTIDSAGVTGTEAVRFLPGMGVADSATPFALGSFEVTPPSDGSVTRYDRTPVMIVFWTQAVNGAAMGGQGGAGAEPTPVGGWLSGTVGGDRPADLAMAFDQGVQAADPRYDHPQLIPLPPMPAGSSLSDGGAGSVGTLSVLGGQSIFTLKLAGGSTPVEAQVDLAPNVPEPASWWIFAGGVGAMVAARRPIRTRQQAGRS